MVVAEIPPGTGSAPLPFANLDPDCVLSAIEALGWRCTGRLFPLNSFENRVYQVEIDEQAPLIAKFYRPGRWSDAAIGEEHAFLSELRDAELEVVAPLAIDGCTLFHHAGHRYSLWPRVGGRAPDLEQPAQLEQLGRTLGRLHQVGAAQPFRHRIALTPATAAEDLQELLHSEWLPTYLADNLGALGAALQPHLQQAWQLLQPVSFRIHGDLHAGNLLAREPHLWLVDFDDCLSGPAVQDLWMLLDSDSELRNQQVDALLEGYSLFRDFDEDELGLIEALRTLRILRHSAWISRRWADPAFPAAFPWFSTPNHWESLVRHLQEQLSLLQEGVGRSGNH